MKANSPAVAGVNFKSDFDDYWEALLLDGPHKGRTIKTKVSNFTQAKWAVADARHGYGVPFNDSTYEQKKTEALHFLEVHCKGLMETSEAP